jgi:hypothetical protein
LSPGALLYTKAALPVIGSLIGSAFVLAIDPAYQVGIWWDFL